LFANRLVKIVRAIYKKTLMMMMTGGEEKKRQTVLRH
jgi:hypothetical protein